MICSKCKLEQPLAEFPRVPGSRWCRQCHRDYQRDHIRTNPAYKARKYRNRVAERITIRYEMIQAYGGKCRCCGEATPEFLTIDHINGGGNQHRREIKRVGWRYYKWLKQQDWPRDLYQLLCMNCNLAKHHFGGCPHQKQAVA